MKLASNVCEMLSDFVSTDMSSCLSTFICFSTNRITETLADAIKSLKQGVSRRLIGSADHFWQKRYYDFNVRNEQQFLEKLRYIHRNPVKRGLCASVEDWRWSSYLQYATGCAGRVEIECEWTARRRSGLREGFVRQLSCRTQAKEQLEWATSDHFHTRPHILTGWGVAHKDAKFH